MTTGESAIPKGWGWIIAQGILFLLILMTGRWGLIRLPFEIRAVGWILLGLAAYMALAALAALGRTMSVFPRPRPEGRLARKGPYRLVRHPIYASLIFATLGWSLWRQHLPGLVLAAALAVFFDRKSRHEERLLLDKYPEYEAYRAETPHRLIPWIY